MPATICCNAASANSPLRAAWRPDRRLIGFKKFGGTPCRRGILRSSGATSSRVREAGARSPFAPDRHRGEGVLMSLQGKTLFITGASRGIGLAIGLRAARDGANVAIAAKTAEPHPKLEGTIYTAAEA